MSHSSSKWICQLIKMEMHNFIVEQGFPSVDITFLFPHWRNKEYGVAQPLFLLANHSSHFSSLLIIRSSYLRNVYGNMSFWRGLVFILNILILFEKQIFVIFSTKKCSKFWPCFSVVFNQFEMFFPFCLLRLWKRMRTTGSDMNANQILQCLFLHKLFKTKLPFWEN